MTNDDIQTGIRQGTQIPPDLRAYSQALLTSLPPQLLIPYLYPTFYSLHNMPPEVRARLLARKSCSYLLPPRRPALLESMASFYLRLCP